MGVFDSPSPRLTSSGFSMTISNTTIASTDFSRFFHDYIKHSHRLDGLQQVFPWLYQTHPSSRLTSVEEVCTWHSLGKTGWSQLKRRVLDIVMEKPAWLYQTHPSPRLTSAGFSMTMSSTHLFNWLQQVFSSLYQTNSPLRLTSAGFFMTISNTPIASTDISRFFHDYIKHTHPLHWLHQYFPWLSNISIASTDFSRFFHKNLLKSVEAVGVFDIAMEKTAEVSWRGVFLT
jgi:hypothetical protein